MPTEPPEIRRCQALVDLKQAELDQAQADLREAQKANLVRVTRDELMRMFLHNEIKPDPENRSYGTRRLKLQMLPACDYEDYRTEYTTYVCLTEDGSDLIAGGYPWRSSDRFGSRDYAYIWKDHRRW